MAKKIVVIRQNSKKRNWVPIGLLQYSGDEYLFSYTNGVKEAEDFTPFQSMPDLKQIYRSKDLMPTFKNRLLSKSRPDYETYVDWLGLENGRFSIMEELAISNGIRATDSLQLYFFPISSNGLYDIKFFVNGVRYLHESVVNDLGKILKPDSKLLLMKDIQNTYNPEALMLRSEKECKMLVGFVPDIYVDDFNRLINANDTTGISVIVIKVNDDAPTQFRILCRFQSQWPDRFVPFDSDRFKEYND